MAGFTSNDEPPCSINYDCENFSLAAGGQICADATVSCSQMSPCDSINMSCTEPNTVCVTDTRCRRPVCYPTAATDTKLRCPPNNGDVCRYGKLPIQFDDIINVCTYRNIPSTYAQFQWHNVMVVCSAPYRYTGYGTVLRSGAYVAANIESNPMTITAMDEKTFTLDSFYASVAWAEVANATFTGLRNGKGVYSRSVKLSVRISEYIQLNWYGIDTFRVETTKGANMAFENLCISY
ncbi:unnamed protein product [Rotaria sp. Silwood2]|nr:unnamed protein product [Rotaria sp. Silwood2]CAF2989112.1 unnamed protein product [Rotaria sp. Silwood2]CAF3213144.1 unnamed protein product [Rotaria sp. Silwood2]CAF3425030.1 unnamed protein product [Rotaria sp. Silwood2]CAF4070236.1 unnamed protein product [Rotaria sp. Silwood2]